MERRNHQLMMIVDSAPMHLNYLDKDEVFLFVNKSAADFWGCSISELIGKKISDLVPSEAYPVLKNYISKVLNGETVSHESPFMTPDGKMGYFLNTYIPDFDSSGQVIGFVATGIDITEKKISFEEAHEKAAQFKQLADSMPQIVWTANPDGYVDYYNERWYSYTGLPPGSADNNLWAQIVHPDDMESLNTTWAHALRTGEPYETEFRVKHHKSGVYRWLLSRARPVRDADGKVIKWYGSNTDINDQKTIQHNLEKEKILRERIISTLTHDLRTPLTAAKMSAYLIAKKSDDHNIQKLAFRIEDNMNRADNMIQDLLDASVVKSGNKLPLKIAKCDIVQIMNKMIEEFTIIHGDRFEATSPPKIEGFWDCEALRRIMENLVSNAIKYGKPNLPVKIDLLEAKDKVQLRVINFGNPLSDGDLPHLFETFKRVTSAETSKGWGIGLSLVKGLAEAHDGFVEVSSSAEAGTVFTVTLPRHCLIESNSRAISSVHDSGVSHSPLLEPGLYD